MVENKLEVGNILYNPKTKGTLEITEIHERKKTGHCWFSYKVLRYFYWGSNGFFTGNSYHNGWDYENYLESDFIVLKDITMFKSKAFKVLYGNKK